MKNDWRKNLRGSFFTLLELLLVLIIILFLSHRLLNSYFKKPSLDKETEKTFSTQGIDTTNYKTVLDSSREKVQNINKQLMDRTRELEEIK